MPLPTKLPSNIEAEKKVLAAAMTNRVSRVEIVASCTESDFFSPSNRTIFKAICDLDAKGIGADCVSVIDGLRSSGKLAAVGGEAYVIELISDDFAQASYEHYVDILRRDTARRNVIAATAEVTSLTNNCYARTEIDELLNPFGFDVSMEHDVFDMRPLCILWKNDMQAGRCGTAALDSLDCRGPVRVASGYGQLSLL